jgi:hypothetical protein
MAALGRHKTLLRMRYRDVDLKFWEDTMELAAWCANWGCSNTLLELYPNSEYHTTFEREYLITLLFEAAPLANLNPAQMIALEIILRRFAANFLFWNAYSDSTPFVFDLRGDTIARRWPKGMEPPPGTRFFGVADAYAQLAGLSSHAKTSRLSRTASSSICWPRTGRGVRHSASIAETNRKASCESCMASTKCGG